MTGRSQ